jgi:hypothetical protein
VLSKDVCFIIYLKSGKSAADGVDVIGIVNVKKLIEMLLHFLLPMANR